MSESYNQYGLGPTTLCAHGLPNLDTRCPYCERDALRAEVERLRDERDGAFTRYDALLSVCGLCRLVNDRDFYRENSAALGHALEIGNAKIEDLRALLLEVAEGGVEFEDPRVRYVAVQIDADTWALVKALTAPAEEEGRDAS